MIELAVCVFIAGLLLVSFDEIFQVTLLLYQRTRAQEIAAMQVDPIKAIFQTHVRECRFALYNSLANAKVGTVVATGGNSLTGLIATGTTNGGGTPALRCTRRDGQGVFIIYWNQAPGGGADPGVYVVTGKALNDNPGDLYNNPIPLSNAITFLSIDTSNGFVDVSLGFPPPLAETNTGGQYIYNRSTTGAGAQVLYNFRVEPAL